MRIIMSVLCSAGTVIGLLILMSNLVSAKHTKGSPLQPVTLESVDISYKVIEKIREPKPKEPVVKAPDPVNVVQAPKSPPKTPTVADPIATPKGFTSINTDITALNIPFVPGVGAAVENSSASPSVRIEPLYPRKALERNLEGFVSLVFDVDEDGRVTNIRVTEANPQNTFNKAAINALRKWKYEPKIENGRGVSILNQTVTLEFQMES